MVQVKICKSSPEEIYRNISGLFSDADDQLYSRISHNVTHVLKPLLPTQTQHSYNLRARCHNFVLIEKDSQINHRHFIIRQSYWLYVFFIMSYFELLSVDYCDRLTGIWGWRDDWTQRVRCVEVCSCSVSTTPVMSVHQTLLAPGSATRCCSETYNHHPTTNSSGQLTQLDVC